MNHRIFILFGGVALGAFLLAWFLFAGSAPPASAQGGNQSCPLTREQAQSAASAFQAMNVVLQSPRCLNCHGAYGDLHTNPQTKHPGGYIPLDSFGKPKDPVKECANCHDLGGSNWQLAPEHMFFADRTNVRVCKQFRSMGSGVDFLNHLDGDKLIALGFDGKKGQSDLPSNPPPIGKEAFLKLAENWVSAIYLTTTQTEWTKSFPGGSDSTCGCDPNNYAQQTSNADEQLERAVNSLNTIFTACSSTKFLECITLEKKTLGVDGFLAREIDGAGSERTDIKVRIGLDSASARKNFDIVTNGFKTPVAGNIENFAAESFAIAGQNDAGVLQAWLDPYYDSGKQAGKAFGHLICGNVVVEFNMFLTGDRISGAPLAERTRSQIKAMIQQVGSAFAGSGVCVPVYLGPSTAPTGAGPGPAPVLATLGDYNYHTIDAQILHPGAGPMDPPNEVPAAPGMELHFGDVVCFKGSGKLDLKWSDGSTVTLSEAQVGSPTVNCLEITVQRPKERSSPGILRQIWSELSEGIRFHILAPSGTPSQVMTDDENVVISVKGTTYILAHDASARASILCAEEGIVHITPQNSSLAALDVSAGNQVRISADSVSPITPGCTLPGHKAAPQPNTAVSRMTLQAGNYYAVAGDTVLVPVWLVRGENLANLNFSVGYDPKVLQPIGDSLKGALLDNTLFTANANQSGIVLVGVAQTSALQGTGTVINIPFRVVGKPGDSTLLLLNVTTINDPTGGSLDVDRIHGAIVVVNEDGTLPAPPDGGGSTGSGGGNSGGGGSTGSGGSGGSGTGNSSAPGGGGTGNSSAPGGGTGGAIPTGGIQKGDCDGSGLLNELDALCALEMSTGIRTMRLFVDVDGSGDVTSRDAVLILQRATGQ